MCSDGGPYPRVRIFYRVDGQLQAQGLWPYTYYAATTIQFVVGTGPGRQVTHVRFPMRLDSAAFVSSVPQRWLSLLGAFLRPFPQTMGFGTAAGQGTGQMAPDTRILFPSDPCRDYDVDFLVTPGLNAQNYGLLSLRDLVRHFAIGIVGDHQLGPNGQPVALPEFELVPR
jgi:hypothetical protein